MVNTVLVDLLLSGNSSRGKAVESAQQYIKSMAVNAIFILEILPASSLKKKFAAFNNVRKMDFVRLLSTAKFQ